MDIPDEKGIYNRWLIVAKANYYVSQFPTFEVLPCDYIFNWVWNGKKIKMAGCLRSQNSYNSGVWTDYKITSPEDQQKFIVSANSLSEKLYYNQRMIIDNKVDVLNGAEPRAWKISKINRINSNGTILVTLAQGEFDQYHDYIEYQNPEDPSTIIGMWADYYKDDHSSVVDYSEPNLNLHSEITCPGKPTIKVSGSYKKLSVTFYKDEDIVSYIQGDWTFDINGNDATSLLSVSNDECEENQIKIKFNGNEDYMGKTLIATYTSYNGITSSIELVITGI